MKRKIAFLTAALLTICLLLSSCGNTPKDLKIVRQHAEGS